MNLISDKPKYQIGDVVRLVDDDEPSHPMVITGLGVYYSASDEPIWYYRASDAFWGEGQPEGYSEESLQLADEIEDDERWYIGKWLERAAEIEAEEA